MKWPWVKPKPVDERQLVQFTFGSPLEAIYTIHAAVLGARLLLYGDIPDMLAMTALHKAAQLIGKDRLAEMADEWTRLLTVSMELVREGSDSIKHQ